MMQVNVCTSARLNGSLAQTGAALPVCLALAALVTMVAAGTLTTAGIETRLITSAVQNQRHFALAEQALSDGYQLAAADPLLWPGSPDIDVVLPHPDARLTLRLLGSDAECPNFVTGTRTHLEVRAALTTATYSSRPHVLGFSVCAESCVTPGCLAAVAAPVTGYWFIEETGG